MAAKISKAFYQNENVVDLAEKLIGKVLVSRIGNELCKGIISETEAYSYKEKACHAYNNRRTNRTETMFLEGGKAYVYFCYGLHHLFNIVSNKKEIAEAVLIRAVQPIEGIDIIKERRNGIGVKNLCNGPAKLCKAFGINMAHNTIDLGGEIIWLEERFDPIDRSNIIASKRIGIDYAGEDKDLLWRFMIDKI